MTDGLEAKKLELESRKLEIDLELKREELRLRAQELEVSKNGLKGVTTPQATAIAAVMAVVGGDRRCLDYRFFREQH
jgi:hypothetical protein